MKTYFLLLLLCLPFLSYAQEERKNPYTTIAGRITDQNGQPLAGAYIQASGGQAPQSSKNPTGNFNIVLFVSKSQAVQLTITLEGYYLANTIVANVYVVKPENRTDFLEIRLTKVPLPVDKKRIAVLPFCDDTNEKENIALIDGAFTAEAANALSRIDETNLEAIPHIIVWNAMQRHSLKKGQYCDRDEINKIASDINANVVLIGMYQKETLGNQVIWRVTGSFLDLANNQSFCRNINETAASLPLLQKKLYEKVLEVLQINTTSEATGILESQTTQTTQNENSYMHTLNSSQYNTQQEPQKAKQEATKAIAADENNYNAYQQRAVAEASAGNTEAAQKDYQKAQEKAEKKGIIKKVIDWIKEKVVKVSLENDYKAWENIKMNNQHITLWSFVERMAVFYSPENGKLGYMDNLGNIIIEPNYDIALSFSEGRAIAIKNSNWYLIDKSGEILKVKQKNNIHNDLFIKTINTMTINLNQHNQLSYYSSAYLTLHMYRSEENTYYYVNGVILFEEETGKRIRLDLNGNEINK